MIQRLAVLGAIAGLSACARYPTEEAAAARRLLALDSQLKQANEQAAAQNDQRLSLLHSRAQMVRLSPQHPLIKRADSLHDATKALLAHVADTRRLLQARTQGEGPRRAALVMLGQPAGLAYPLLQKIAAYRAALHALDTTVAPLQLVPRPLLAADTPAAVAQFYFQDATPEAALVSLAQLEALLLAQEATVLQAQEVRIACGGNIVFSAVGARAVAESNVVAAGTEYHAELFLASALQPTGVRMQVNGQPIAVDETGRGQVRFVTDPRQLGSQQAVQAYWTGLIRTRSPYTRSGDTTYKVRVPYRIVRGHEPCGM